MEAMITLKWSTTIHCNMLCNVPKENVRICTVYEVKINFVSQLIGYSEQSFCISIVCEVWAVYI